MSFFQALLIFLGLSLDSFVVMMNKAATVRNLTVKKSFLFAGIFAIVDVMAILIGYGIASTFKAKLNLESSMGFAALIIFAIGLYITIKAYKSAKLEEVLDKNFGNKRCFLLAMETSLDTLFLGVSLSLIGITLAEGVSMALFVTFVTSMVAQLLGYRHGSTYSKVFGMSGGCLMIVFSLVLMLRFVIQ